MHSRPRLLLYLLVFVHERSNRGFSYTKKWRSFYTTPFFQARLNTVIRWTAFRHHFFRFAAKDSYTKDDKPCREKQLSNK